MRAGREEIAGEVVGLDADNWAVVYAGGFRGRVTGETVSAFVPFYRQNPPATVKGSRVGAVLVEPYATQEGGRPAVRMRYRLRSTRGVVVTSELVEVFAEGRDVFVSCQAERGREREIAAGCQMILDTLDFGAS